MSQKKYWKGLEELENSPAFQEQTANEFRETLPFADVSDSMLAATTPRRDFLKYLGFSTAAAILVSSCEMPVRRAIPYAIKPEDITPGVANYYASSFCDGGDYCAIVIKTRDGRPIKIEGNEMSSITHGGTSARVQASVLGLYDNARLRGPYADGKTVDMFNPIDRQVLDGLAAAGKTNYILTSTILSPTVLSVIDQFISKYPNTKHVTWDAMSASGMLMANEACYGKRALPSYHFDNADTIVSLGADFLGTWISPIEFARQYGMRRKLSAKNPVMSRHYQVEGNHTISGASADVRAVAKPSEMGAVAVALYNALDGTAPAFKSQTLNALITGAANDLKKGKGLVISGSNDVNVQTMVNAINDKIGANGSTIDWSISSNYRKGIDSEMVQLVADMNAGTVGTLIVHGANPVYEYFDSNAVVQGMSKVPVTISTNDRMDETAAKCKFIVPDHHYLESWGDAEPKTGYFSLMQPGISPLFKTRGFADSLLTWAGSTTAYADMWKDYWMGKMGSQAAFDQAVQDGVIEPGSASSVTKVVEDHVTATQDTFILTPVMTLSGASFGGNVAGAAAAIAAMAPSSGMELMIYEKVAIGRGGCWSNNPWLQEMPDPITKATWDNYACISPGRAKDLDAGKGQDYEVTSINEVDHNKRMIKVNVNGKTLTMPAVVVPGMHNDVVAIAVGYGRAASVGRASANNGQNAYPFRVSAGSTIINHAPATIEATAERYDVAITQTHNSYEGRTIIREFTLNDFKSKPNELLEEREEEIGHFAHYPWMGAAAAAGEGHGEHETHEGSGERQGANSELEQGFREKGTLYPNYDHPGIHWGMSIDLNSCIGCGACTISCQAENNVSVVGKAEVMKAQEMHWLTIDRYFAGNPDNPDSIQTIFQPMLCQHCDNAPCENVCPVSATNHSSEGINQMAYNRCIGTKYCANNCPYKVRHFNWFDWNGADCFEDNLYEDGRRDGMNDDLTRMVLNPDVTVRSRGVMEKCTFCVQRLQDVKLTAKKDNRPVRDGEARTACQTACPTNAIMFGNVNDKTSAIFQLRAEEQRERTFYVLEEYHTLPNVNYLSKIRNTDKVMGGKGHEETDIMMRDHI